MFNNNSNCIIYNCNYLSCFMPEADSHPSVAEEFARFEIPPNLSEDSMEDVIPPDNIVPNYEVHPVQFEVIMSSSQCGKQKLVDGRGFS